MGFIKLSSDAASGHPANYRTPLASNATPLASGCSTTDPYLNGNATSLARGANSVGSGYTITGSTIPGSSAQFRSQNAPDAPDPDPWSSMVGYDTLIMADNPAMSSWSYPGIYLAWAQKAWAVDAEFIIWNPQSFGHNNESFTDQDIEDYYLLQIQRHEAWQDEVNSQLPAGQKICRLVPGANIFLSMFYDQNTGNTPTSTWYDDLYLPADGIHVNDIGRYISSMTMAAFLWGIDPFDMPDTCNALNGGNAFTDAAYIKGKVSAGIKAYSRAGVDTSGWA